MVHWCKPLFLAECSTTGLYLDSSAELKSPAQIKTIRVPQQPDKQVKLDCIIDLKCELMTHVFSCIK